jgi:hypothetical protein
MMLLKRVPAPRHQSRLKINEEAAWYSWSPAFRRFARDWRRAVAFLKRPALVEVPHLGEYCYTYSIPISEIRDRRIRRSTREYALDLFRMPKPRRIMLLTDLFDDVLDSRCLRILLAMFRSELARAWGDPRFALNSPLSFGTRKDTGFALHSDLYLPEMLLNIFDKVPTDSSGASIFLHVDRLNQILTDADTLPRETRRRIEQFFTCSLPADGFADLYDLLHGRRHKWVRFLERQMAAAQLRIKLHRGQGYLIHDRTWLHGREPANGSVTTARFHRFVFGTRSLHSQHGRKPRCPA